MCQYVLFISAQTDHIQITIAMLPVISIITLMIISNCFGPENNTNDNMETISLPEPSLEGDISLEKTLKDRRSVRSYSDKTISAGIISQLAWAAQGISDRVNNFRTAPSAGATYPIELYFVVSDGHEPGEGVYRYDPGDHALDRVHSQDMRRDIYQMSLQQDPIIDAPVVLVITGVLERTAQRYGERAERFMYMEAGHVSQNIYLQSTALELGTVAIGAFDDEGIMELMELEDGEYPLYIMPVGHY